MSGLQACRAFRELSDIPIIMLTAMSSDAEVVRSLESGADDCLVKPFSRQVLPARIRAVLRQAELSPERWGPLRYEDDHLALDPAQQQVAVQGRPVKLTSTEYYIFECLVCNADHLLPPPPDPGVRLGARVRGQQRICPRVRSPPAAKTGTRPAESPLPAEHPRCRLPVPSPRP